jgi:uncharacterized protein YdiU (UPF0061 family)
LISSDHARSKRDISSAWPSITQWQQLLVDYAIDRHYPAAAQAESPIPAFFAAVVERQAASVAHWMDIGFIHGVMDTDNMAISGETLDYGPRAFMDEFDFDKVFSSIDRDGPYAYAEQAGIAQWNLTRLAECLMRLQGDETGFESQLMRFEKLFRKHYQALSGAHGARTRPAGGQARR